MKLRLGFLFVAMMLAQGFSTLRFLRDNNTRCSYKNAVSYLDAIRNGSVDEIVIYARSELNKLAHALNLQNRKVVFTHVPKSAGTSVKTVLKTWDRFYSKGHVHFNLTDLEFNHGALHFTIIRKPSSRAASLFSYINMFPHINTAITWNVTHQYAKNPLEWIRQPLIQNFIGTISVAYFGHNFVDLFAMIKSFRQTWASGPDKRFDIVTKTRRDNYLWEKKDMEEIASNAPDLSQMYDKLNYLLCMREIPEELRCQDHVNVIFLLLNRYSVVGELDDYENIWKILRDRVGLPTSFERVVSQSSRNTHKESAKASTETPLTTDPAVRKAFDVAVQNVLYCENVVYEVARRIHAIDLQLTSFNDK